MTALPLALAEMRDRPRRAFARAGALVVALLSLAFALLPAARAEDAVRGVVTIGKEDGFSRMVFRFDEEVAAKVKVNDLIMVISFAKPVALDVDKLNAAVNQALKSPAVCGLQTFQSPLGISSCGMSATVLGILI